MARLAKASVEQLASRPVTCTKYLNRDRISGNEGGSVRVSHLARNLTIGRFGRSCGTLFATFVSCLALILYASAAAAQSAPATGTAGNPAPTVAPVSSAAATASDDTPEAIVVTGSRITAAGFDAPTPTQVLGADMLAKAAQPNIFTAVTQLPSLQGSTGTTVANGNTSTGATGLSGLNLRGLGTFRTLTLLDGQRVVPSNVSNITDISQFPQLLIERVEVVTGGASASYGSDAVAGVVNFITNKRFEGFKANFQGGITTYGDDAQGNAQVAYGRSFFDSRLHVAISGEFFHSDGIIPGGKQGGLPVNGRPQLPRTGSPSYSLAGTPAGSPQFNYILNGAQNISQGQNVLISSGPLQGTAFGDNGVPYQLRYGGSGIPNRTAAGGVAGCINTTCQGGDFIGPNSTAGGDSAIDGKIERYVGYGRVSYEVADWLELYGTVNIANVYTVTQPTQGTPTTGLTAQCDNAFLAQSVKDACTANKITSFQFGTVGANLNHYLDVRNTRRQRRFVGGAEGSFDVFGKKWTFDGYFEHGKSYTTINVKNNVLRALYNLAYDAIVVNGQIVCRSIAARAAGCLPYNIFGNVQNSEAAFRWFAPTSGSQSHGSQQQDAGSLAFNGTPFSLWAGDVSVAFGGEWRKEKYHVFGDAYGAGNANTPNDAEFPANALLATSGDNWYAGNFKDGKGRFDVKEFFLETGIPLLDSNALGKFDFNAAIRETDYSTSGWVTTWKLGATWQTPLDGLRLRAVRSRDIRAPNLSDLFAAPVNMNNSVLDRFNGDKTVTILNSTVGNPDLKPEIASNLEAGFVYQPRFLPGLSVSFDYFDLDVKGAIQVLTNQQIVDLCFNGNTQFCGTSNFFLGGTPGTNNPSYVIVKPFNLASLKTRGYDLEASYRFNLNSVGVPGRFTLRGLATRTINFKTNPGVPGQPISQLAGNNNTNNPAPGATGVARWKALLQQSYEIGKVQFNVTERIISSGKINPNYIVCQVGSCPVPTVQNPTSNYNYIAGRTYVDFGLNYQFRKQISVFGKVDNLFNKLAPIFGSNSLYDTIGRRFQAGVRLNY